MRSWRVRANHVKVAAAIGLVAVLGMASLAAASPGNPTGQAVPGPAKVDPVPADPEADVTDGSDEPSKPPAGDDQAASDAAGPSGTDTEAPPAVTPGTCPTHGQRVSAIAHSTPPGPGHGAAVSTAAHDHTGECAHTDADSADAGDDLAAPPTDSPVPAASLAPDHHGPRHDTGGQQGQVTTHGQNKG